jgi:hypothetical protein
MSKGEFTFSFLGILTARRRWLDSRLSTFDHLACSDQRHSRALAPFRAPHARQLAGEEVEETEAMCTALQGTRNTKEGDTSDLVLICGRTVGFTKSFVFHTAASPLGPLSDDHTTSMLTIKKASQTFETVHTPASSTPSQELSQVVRTAEGQGVRRRRACDGPQRRWRTKKSRQRQQRRRRPSSMTSDTNRMH